jgi:hypothetical protein
MSARPAGQPLFLPYTSAAYVQLSDPGYDGGVQADPPQTAPPGAAAGRVLRLSLLLALGLGGAARVALALGDHGIYWSDEVYQGLEPAHYLAFGYGLLPWEFIHGARSWLLPGALAGLFKLCALLGGDSPGVYLPAAKLLFGLLSLATALAAMSLARACGAGRAAAASAALVMALAAPAIYFAPRATGEVASALAATAGLALALGRGRKGLLAGAALLGLATALRLQCGLLCLGLLGILLGRRRWREALEALAVLLLVALAMGLLDRLTWGRWFWSSITYLRFNLLQGGSGRYGTAGPLYYAGALWGAMPLLLLPLAALAVTGATRAPGLALTALAYLLAHSLVGHKELRFLLPLLPLLAALAAVGLQRLPRGRVRWLALAALALLSLGSAGRTFWLSMGDLGQRRFGPPRRSALDFFGPVNRLLLAASRRPDLCGLKIAGVNLVWTGGYSHLHRRVPLYGAAGPPLRSGRFNYIIAPLARARGHDLAATDGGLALVRLPRRRCAPDPGFVWRVDPALRLDLPLPPRGPPGWPPPPFRAKN